jgi:hypothetical protein
LIVRFGDLTIGNFSEVNQLAAIVKFNIEKPINIEVLRKAEKEDVIEEFYTYKGEDYKLVKCEVTPRKWEGEGVLGYDIPLFINSGRCRFAILK